MQTQESVLWCYRCNKEFSFIMKPDTEVECIHCKECFCELIEKNMHHPGTLGTNPSTTNIQPNNNRRLLLCHANGIGSAVSVGEVSSEVQDEVFEHAKAISKAILSSSGADTNGVVLLINREFNK